MFRFFGLLTGSGLLAATMWMVNATSAQDSPFDPPSGAGTPAPSGTAAPAAAQNPFAAQAASSTSTDAGRSRVNDYLKRARAAQKQGDKAQALLWAMAADRTARELKIAFRVGEQTPAQLVAQLQGRPASGATVADSRPAQSPQSANPFAAAAPAPTQQPEPAATPKEQAQALLAQARTEMSHQHYDEARKLALQAQSFDVAYELLDDQPQFILTEIERQTGQHVIAAGTPASEPAAQSNPFGDLETANAEPAAIDAHQQADALMAEAGDAFRAGNHTGARALATQAAGLDVQYTEFEESPAMLLSAIDSAEQSASEPAPESNPFTEGPLDLTAAPAGDSRTAAAPQNRRVIQTEACRPLTFTTRESNTSARATGSPPSIPSRPPIRPARSSTSIVSSSSATSSVNSIRAAAKSSRRPTRKRGIRSQPRPVIRWTRPPRNTPSNSIGCGPTS